MRALILSSELPPGPGGIGAHAHHVACRLVAHDWSIVVAAPQDYASDDEVSEWSSRQPYRIERLRHWPTALAQGIVWWRHIARAIQHHQPDVVIASGLRIVWLAAALARVHRRPWIAVGHGFEFGVGGWARALVRWAYGRAEAVVCVSRYTLQRLERAGVRAKRTVVIPNGADGAVFGTSVARAERPAGAPLHLVTVGTVSSRKGQDLVIRALPRLVAAGVDVRYTAIGLAPTAETYKALASELGVGERVELRGARPTAEIVETLRAADLFVLPSRHTPAGDFEGFGIAVVEAALCGIPAVVARDSGLVEAIAEGRTGLSVPPDDPEALAEALVVLLTDEPRRLRMGEQARRRAVEEQTWAKRGTEYDGLLRDLVAARRH